MEGKKNSKHVITVEKKKQYNDKYYKNLHEETGALKKYFCEACQKNITIFGKRKHENTTIHILRQEKLSKNY